MKTMKYILPFAIVLVSIVVALVIVNSKKQIVTQPPETQPPQLRVMQAKKQDVQMTVRSQGTVRAKTESEIVAQVAGVIEGVSPSFVAGGFYKQGDVLVVLDARDYEHRLAQAKYQVAQAQLALKMEEQQADIAREEWLKMNEGEAPPLVSREPQMAQARALLESANASFAQAELDLERTKIRAPFDGRVRSKKADIGRYVTPGMSLASIYSTDAAEVRLPLPDQELAYLDLPFDFQASMNNGRAVVLKNTFAGKEHTWTARLTHAEGEIDPRSRMIYVVARVSDPYSSRHEMPLTVGMFVNADIQGKTVKGLIKIPRVAMRNENEVLIVDDNSQLWLRDVNVFRSSKEHVYVDAGLKEGELICLSNPGAFVEGMHVTPIKESLAAQGER